MSALRTHYDNLKIPRNASFQDIRYAYKRLCQRYHPDKSGGRPSSNSTFILIRQAYDVLSCEESRCRHDAWIAREEAKRYRPPVDVIPSSVLRDLAEHQARERARERCQRNRDIHEQIRLAREAMRARRNSESEDFVKAFNPLDSAIAGVFSPSLSIWVGNGVAKWRTKAKERFLKSVTTAVLIGLFAASPVVGPLPSDRYPEEFLQAMGESAVNEPRSASSNEALLEARLIPIVEYTEEWVKDNVF